MKLIQLSQVGYNNPQGANWAYGVWKLDLINTDEKHNASYTLKENFGGDYRLIEKVKELHGVDIHTTRGVYTGTGTQRMTGMSKVMDLEGEEILEIINEFLK